MLCPGLQCMHAPRMEVAVMQQSICDYVHCIRIGLLPSARRPLHDAADLNARNTVYICTDYRSTE